MPAFNVNKGVGRSVEFYGLRAQYVVYLAVVVVGCIFLYFIVSIFFNLIFSVVLCGIVAFSGCLMINRFNGKYGENGLMQTAAQRNLPKGIVCNKRIYTMFKKEKNEH